MFEQSEGGEQLQCVSTVMVGNNYSVLAYYPITMSVLPAIVFFSEIVFSPVSCNFPFSSCGNNEEHSP